MKRIKGRTQIKPSCSTTLPHQSRHHRPPPRDSEAGKAGLPLKSQVEPRGAVLHLSPWAVGPWPPPEPPQRPPESDPGGADRTTPLCGQPISAGQSVCIPESWHLWATLPSPHSSDSITNWGSQLRYGNQGLIPSSWATGFFFPPEKLSYVYRVFHCFRNTLIKFFW